MKTPPLISVVCPIHSSNHKLEAIRNVLLSSNVPIELIVVINNPEISVKIVPQNFEETVVKCPRRGRGYAFLAGIAEVRGRITMLLHSDTVPPLGWDHVILSALANPDVVGGGFSLSYDTRNPLLEIVSWLSNQWVRLTKEMYGDRAMFVQTNILERCLSALDVPLYEDLRLARCMLRQGDLILANQKIETSAVKYQKYGVLEYLRKIWLSRIWYHLGVSTSQIYDMYYS